MSKNFSRLVFLDTTFLNCFLDKKRDGHEVAVKYFEYWIRNKVVISTSTICIAEYAAYAQEMHSIFKKIIAVPFNTEAALLAGNLFREYKKSVMETMSDDKTAGKRDALKDDFKIVASAAQINASAIAHNDASSMEKFLARARRDFTICKDLKSILLSNGFNEELAGFSQTGDVTSGLPLFSGHF